MTQDDTTPHQDTPPTTSERIATLAKHVLEDAMACESSTGTGTRYKIASSLLQAAADMHLVEQVDRADHALDQYYNNPPPFSAKRYLFPKEEGDDEA